MSGVKRGVFALALCLAGCLEFPTEAACNEPGDCPNGFRCDPESGACLPGDGSETDGDAPDAKRDDGTTSDSKPDGPTPDTDRDGAAPDATADAPGRLVLAAQSTEAGEIIDMDGEARFTYAETEDAEELPLFDHDAALEPGVDGIGVVFNNEPRRRVFFVRTSFARRFGDDVEVAPGPAGEQYYPGIHWVGGHFVVVWIQVVDGQGFLAFRRVARDGAPRGPTQVTDVPIGDQLHTIAVDDRIYATWIRVEDGVSMVYAARGPFGCGVFEAGDED